MAAAEPVWHGRAPGAVADGQAGDGHSPWRHAARLGPADPVLARAGLACFAAADAALGRSGAPGTVRDAVAAFADKYAARGRCPADDMLDEMLEVSR